MRPGGFWKECLKRGLGCLEKRKMYIEWGANVKVLLVIYGGSKNGLNRKRGSMRGSGASGDAGAFCERVKLEV